jgi:hypothetical protein
MGLIEKIREAVSLDDLSDEELAAELSEPPRFDDKGGALNTQALAPEFRIPIQEQGFERLTAAMMKRTKTAAPDVAKALEEWAAAMAAHHTSPTVRVHNPTLSWLAALVVVRYGEAPISGGVPFWPSVLGPADVERAVQWAKGVAGEAGGRVPFRVSGKGPGAFGTLT